MFNFKITNRFILVAILAAGIVACEEEDDYTIPQGNVEEVVPREEVVVINDITLTASDEFVVEGRTQPITLTVVAPDNVTKIAFFNGETLLGEDEEAPYTNELDLSGATAYNNMNIIAQAFSDGVPTGDTQLTIHVGERYAAGSGTLTGDGNEVFNTDGPEGNNYPADRKYGAFINIGGAPEESSGVNIPIEVPEDGQYYVSMGLASGWVDAESFGRFYFDENPENVQRTEEVPPTGWISFDDYLLPEPYTLTAGQHVAKMRFGGPYVHYYYVDVFKAEGAE